MKHWPINPNPISIIFDMQQRKQVGVNNCNLAHFNYCCYITLWNAEVVVWPFTTTNSYWAALLARVSAQKITETTKSRICYLFNINRIHFKIVRTYVDKLIWRIIASEPLWVTWLLNVLLASGVNVHRLRSCWRTFWAHAVKRWRDVTPMTVRDKISIHVCVNQLIVSEPTHARPSMNSLL